MFALKGAEGKALLDRWLAWARRCRIPAFVDLAARITKHRTAIHASLEHRLSNGLVESTIIWSPETTVVDVADEAV